MKRKNLCKPHSFSLTTTFLDDMRYLKITNPSFKLSQEAERVLRQIVPHRKE